jgi:hypothetical protein
MAWSFVAPTAFICGEPITVAVNFPFVCSTHTGTVIVGILLPPS